MFDYFTEILSYTITAQMNRTHDGKCDMSNNDSQRVENVNFFPNSHASVFMLINNNSLYALHV